MAAVLNAPNVVVPVGGRGRFMLTVQDADGDAILPFSVSASVSTIDGQVIGTYEYPGAIASVADGQFSVEILAADTQHPTTMVATWTVELEMGGEIAYATSTCRVISAAMGARLADFRLLIDKSRKLVDMNNDCFLGYTDDQLMSYLDGGMATINAYQPGGVRWTLEGYPWHLYGQIALESGLIVGVMSQQLFAVDTDLPNYSDQGSAFTLQHQPQLAAFFQQVATRLDKMIPQMKLNFVGSGSLHVQQGANYRYQALLDAAPNGSLFRNLIFKG